MSRRPLVGTEKKFHGCPAIARFRSGFTLIEMLVALVIMGILFFVALPGYEYAVVKSTRASARGALLDLVSRQEQYFVNHKRYATTLVQLGLSQNLYVDGQGDAVDRGSAAYQIRLELEDGSYSGVQAVPLHGQSADAACLTFSLSRIGVRAVTGAQSPGNCW
tara:strand:- start:31778 stop:32266 length:489 start_codon:yes stop_codon:yes gene_type:complete